MAKPIHMPAYRLAKKDKKALSKMMKGEASIMETSVALGYTHQRIYTMVTSIIRHACQTKKINIEEVLKDY